MKVVNIHARRLPAAPAAVGALLDTLASADDRLWPCDRWPRMRFDRPLGPGAAGGHGPIAYVVEEYEPVRRIRFRFTRPRGFVGYHEFRVGPLGRSGDSHLEHRLIMDARGAALVSWLLIFRPLHDALIEDALANAEARLCGTAAPHRWSTWVVLLRHALRALHRRATRPARETSI